MIIVDDSKPFTSLSGGQFLTEQEYKHEFTKIDDVRLGYHLEDQMNNFDWESRQLELTRVCMKLIREEIQSRKLEVVCRPENPKTKAS
jgi:hypothetical protein